MKITSARKWARTTIRNGYYRMSDTDFKIQCPVLSCREMVKISDWVGNLNTASKIENRLIDALTGHLKEDH